MLRTLVLAALVACRSGTSETQPMPKPPAHDVEVTWKLARTGDALAVSYQVTNATGAPIYVLDQPIGNDGDRYKVLADRAYVTRGQPHVVRFVRGYLDAESQLPDVEQGDHDTIFPGVRTVAPGGKLDGAFSVPLPIEPWRPGLEMADVKDPQRAVLEIGYVTTDGPWSELPAASGTIRTATRITVKSQRWIRGDEQKIP
ncbi:MAG: hypothetical protein ACM31C_07865 [Acidobacteriota bacterium]